MSLPASASTSAAEADGLPEAARVERAVLLTIHYRDLFSHAPTR
ncbi:MAG: hypothetical protein RJA22_2851, partial [Verrucomicrobiota bacterium]